MTNLKDLKFVVDNYDCGIYYADLMVGRIFEKIRELGIYDDVAVIITSDHGENMGELGIYSEHATADHGTCHIPMIIKWPGGMKNYEDDSFHYNIDLAPTIADLLNVKKSDEWDGNSYSETITEGKQVGNEYLVLSQMAHVCQRSARFGDWLYIRTYHCGYHLFDKEMLFNIKNDPYEQFDVKDDYPEICAKGAKYILDWHDEMMMSSGQLHDPMFSVLREGGPEHARGKKIFEDYIDRLEHTNRGEGAKILMERYSKYNQ